MAENTSKIINIKTEILFREAEDDFYYFGAPKTALRKLQTALELTEGHFKSLMLAGNICFVLGYINKARKFFERAKEVKPSNYKVYAAIANCFKNAGKTKKALEYCDNAILLFDYKDYPFYANILEMKTELLLDTSDFKAADFVFKKLKRLSPELPSEYNFEMNFAILNEKLKTLKKISDLKLRVI